MKRQLKIFQNHKPMLCSVLLIAAHKLMSIWLMSLELRMQSGRSAVKTGHREKETEKERDCGLCCTHENNSRLKALEADGLLLPVIKKIN